MRQKFSENIAILAGSSVLFDFWRRLIFYHTVDVKIKSFSLLLLRKYEVYLTWRRMENNTNTNILSLVISHKKRGKILQSRADIIVEKVHSSRYMYYVYFFIYRNMKGSLKTFFT